MNVKEWKMLDITPEEGVQVSVSRDGKVMWVNVDGVCVLRLSNIPSLEVDDPFTNEIEEGGE